MKTLDTSEDLFESLYSLGRKLGSGAFANVYEAVGKADGHKYAVKVSPVKGSSRMIRHERDAYNWLNEASDEKYTGLPKSHYFGRVNIHRESHHALVIDRLGPSLDDMFKKFGTMSLKSILMIGIQAISALEFMHENDYVHCDVKPDNMLLDAMERRKLYFADLGLSKPYRSYPDCEHVRMRYGSTKKAVSLFASLNWHEGINASRRDDMESLGYVLVYLFKGSLPWEGLDVVETHECKRRYPIVRLCEGMSAGFINFFFHVRGLQFEDQPDYWYLRHSLLRSLDDLGYEKDSFFEWNIHPLQSKPLKGHRSRRTKKKPHERHHRHNRRRRRHRD